MTGQDLELVIKGAKAEGRRAGMLEAATFADHHAVSLSRCGDVHPEKVAGARKVARLLYAMALSSDAVAGRPVDEQVRARYMELARPDGEGG